jgi:hypothetical protein
MSHLQPAALQILRRSATASTVKPLNVSRVGISTLTKAIPVSSISIFRVPATPSRAFSSPAHSAFRYPHIGELQVFSATVDGVEPIEPKPQAKTEKKGKEAELPKWAQVATVVAFLAIILAWEWPSPGIPKKKQQPAAEATKKQQDGAAKRQ